MAGNQARVETGRKRGGALAATLLVALHQCVMLASAYMVLSHWKTIGFISDWQVLIIFFVLFCGSCLAIECADTLRKRISAEPPKRSLP